MQAAIRDGKPTLTLSLRLPGQLERDPAQMRRYANQLALSITYNTPPDVPTDLQAGGKACTTSQPYAYVGRGDVRVEAAVSDADMAVEGHGDRLSAIFALWPVGRPQDRIERESIAEFQGRMWHEFPADTFADNATYAWQVRASDSEATSKWSKVCYFRTDLLAPNPPSVSSPDYPDDGAWHGGVGIPGQFTFTAGTADVVGFRYGFWSASTYVAAGPGGRATVTVTPTQPVSYLVVQSIDRAGNASSETVYYVRANDTEPIVEGTLEAIGVPTPFTFRPGMPGVVEYRYRVGDQPEHTVAADADGVAHVEITTRSGGSLWLTVTSRTAAGVRSAPSASSTCRPRRWSPRRNTRRASRRAAPGSRACSCSPRACRTWSGTPTPSPAPRNRRWTRRRTAPRRSRGRRNRPAPSGSTCGASAPTAPSRSRRSTPSGCAIRCRG